MRILAINGSSSSTSIHRTLLDVVHTLVDKAVIMEIVDLTAVPAPLFSVDIEKASGAPTAMRELAARIDAADAVIIASPEHNGLPPAILKNAIDWLSRVEAGKKWLAKPVLFLSTSPGPNGGATNLKNLASLAPWWGADVVGAHSVGRFYDVIDVDNLTVRDELELARLQASLLSLVEAAPMALAAK